MTNSRNAANPVTTDASPNWRLSHPAELPNGTVPTLSLRVTDTRDPTTSGELLILSCYPDHEVHYRTANAITRISSASRLEVSAGMGLCAGPKSFGVLVGSKSEAGFVQSFLSRQARSSQVLLQHAHPATGALLSVFGGIMVILFLSFAASGHVAGHSFALLGACLSAIVSFAVTFTAARPRSHYIGLTLIGISFGVVLDAMLFNRTPAYAETRMYLLEVMSFWSALTFPVVTGHVMGRVAVWFQHDRIRSQSSVLSE
jgi:hypothetical protein